MHRIQFRYFLPALIYEGHPTGSGDEAIVQKTSFLLTTPMCVRVIKKKIPKRIEITSHILARFSETPPSPFPLSGF